MADTTVEQTAEIRNLVIDTSAAEAAMDRLIAKAQEFKEIMDSVRVPAREDQPQIVYSINLGDLRQILNAPAQGFAPEFNAKLAEDLPKILTAKPAMPQPKPSGKKPIIYKA